MKKIYYIVSIFMSALFLASSCQQEEVGSNGPEPLEVTLTATSKASKTVLDENKVKWENGDEIALVFSHPESESHVERFSTAFEDESPVASAKFKGTIASGVSSAAGYDDEVLAVYPYSALTGSDVAFNLPELQQTKAGGSFDSELNLAAAYVSLADMEDDGKADATLLNSCSIIRISLPSYAVSISLTGTSPLAGLAPLAPDQNGRLVIDPEAEWSESYKETTVTLVPEDGASNFDEATAYNLLIWPGSHTSLVIEMKDAGGNVYRKTIEKALAFSPAKYYTLNPNFENEVVMGIEGMEETIPTIDQRLEATEEKTEDLEAIQSQIQSMSLMSEYLDNSVAAPYAVGSYSSLYKKNIELNYIVRPASAAEELLERCKTEGTLSDVLSAKIDYKDGNIGSLSVDDAVLDGDIMTLSVNPGGLSDYFYTGGVPAAIAVQISDGNTEYCSDFASLVPKTSVVLGIYKTSDIPVLKGASLSVNFNYGAGDLNACSVTVENVKGFASAPSVSCGNGIISFNAAFGENADLSQMSVDVVLASGDETDRQTLTFADGGNFVVETTETVDYIGGEVLTTIVTNDFPGYTSELKNGGSWIYQAYTGNNSILTVTENTGAQREARLDFVVNNGIYKYGKSVTVTQKAYGTSIDESKYYSDGNYLKVNTASSQYATPLNVVILGDGYQKKDLQKGGKFERAARSACEAFFGVAPFSHFRDRFNVYMATFASVDEGVDVTSGNVTKNTYFDTYCAGGNNTLAYFNDDGEATAVNVVKNTLGFSADKDYYRTIVIVLANTAESAGSCGYPVQTRTDNTSVTGENYRSFAICVLAANSTGTSGLVRHEAGGHAFGRLGDEYAGKTYGNIDSNHANGYYQNITTNQDNWNWNEFIGRTGYENVTYYQHSGADYWCPTSSSIMYNNNGVFNAPSRRAIYERIIRQTEGYNAYSFEKFLEYDKQNL